MITFEIYEDAKVSHVLRFKSEPSATTIKIGRVSSSDLRFERDDQVARMHAVIEVTYEGVVIWDLGSPLGTCVNGSKIHRHKLRSGDVIEVGRQRIKISFDSPSTTKDVTVAIDDGAN